MKNVLLGLSMVAIILAGVLAGCFATNAIMGENPFQLVQRWREEDAGKLSNEADDLKDEQGEDDGQSGEPEESDGNTTGTEAGQDDVSNLPPEEQNTPAEANTSGSKEDSTSATEPSNAIPNEEIVSLDTLCALIEMTLSQNYSGCDVSYDDTGITANIWSDGVAMATAYLQESGGAADKENWEVAKEATVGMSRSLRGLMDTMGHSDALLVINVLNDLNHDNVLLSMVDSTIIYDVLAE